MLNVAIKICKQNGGQWAWSMCSLFVMAVTAKGNSYNYSKPRKDCTETTSSLSSLQTSRFLLVFSLSYSINFRSFTCSSCLDQTKVEVVLRRDLPGLEWTRLGGELPNVQRSFQLSVCGTFPTYFEKGHKLQKSHYSATSSGHNIILACGHCTL